MKTKTNLMMLREHEKGAPIEILLRGYVAQGMTDQEIADELGISRQCLYNWLDELKAEITNTRVRSISFGRETAAV